MNIQPLADRLRPTTFEEVAGQAHLVGEKGIIRKLTAGGRIPNMIFYGPPGTGKTTVANIIAKNSGMQLHKLNATTASLQDIKDVIASCDNIFSESGTLLYLDEIQYFNKKQQQSLLEFMENGKITLIASTTDNPYFCLYKAILSRSSVFEFKSITAEDCIPTLRRALATLNSDFQVEKSCDDKKLLKIARSCAGDLRMSISALENVYYASDEKIDDKVLDELLPSVVGVYDRDGDSHYDLLSCLQKSIRGSDPNAAVFYLAKILASGDIISPIRRLQVIASEDIGCAYPMAGVITRSLCESARELGLPEAAIPLANCAVILATAPKSNTSYIAYARASQDLASGKGVNPPPHLQSPLFKGYLYPHDYENDYIPQQYLPDDITDAKYYEFGQNKTEQLAKAYYEMIRNGSHSKK